MRSLTFNNCVFILLLACKPGGGGSGEESSGEPGSSSSASGGPTDTGGEPTTGGGTAGTTGPGTTTPPGTTTSDASTTAGPTSEPGTTDVTGSTSEPGTTTDASTTTGEPAGPECDVDADCKLHSDCCACEGVPVDEEVANCEKECKQPLCSEFGVEAAVCRLGVCETERLSCDQSKVVCDAPTPDCPDGTLPETTPECWTGKCVPSALCDVVPGCEFCGPEQFCVTKLGEGVFPTVCEPLPGACGGTSSCNCVAELVCIEPFGQCFQQDTLEVSCECPNC